MHIFLTGKVGVGKSTIINTWLRENPSVKLGGFRSISDPNNPDKVYLVGANESNPNFSELNLAGIKRKGKPPLGFKEAFNSFGCELLKSSDDIDVILMDELGIMENEADDFIDSVFDILNKNTPVLGVIKPKNTVFLNKIRAHKNVEVITVTEENRDDPAWFMEKISNILKV